MTFNHKSRRTNIIRSSVVSMVCKIVNLVLGFGYRLLFLRILSVQYLGINGLFTNILGVLALAELGITNAIIYRFYEPISEDNVEKVGQLMRFFKKAYWVIALVIILLGCLTLPFLNYFIKDSAEIPTDVNLYLIFLLFLLQTASTYLFSYKLTLLTADQKQYQYSIISTAISFGRYVVQTVILVISKDYTLTLLVGIGSTILLNLISSQWVTKQYSSVFCVSGTITTEEKKAIYSDTSAAMLHKIGGTVLTSTDNLLMSKFVGLTVTGVYSNYALVISSLSGIVGMLFSSFTASLGNAHVTLEKEQKYALYRKSLFINFGIAGLASVCLFTLINNFIVIWLEEPLLLGEFTVALLCIQFFLESVRCVTASYTMACGLFVRDRIRPAIEAVLNIVISIIALNYIGTAGIFLGTIISCMLTVFWREPYLLYKYIFEISLWEYWIEYMKNVGIIFASMLFIQCMKKIAFQDQINLVTWLSNAVLSVVVYCIVHFVVFHRSSEYKYFLSISKNYLNRMIHKYKKDSKL